jgi:hypothetical protein
VRQRISWLVQATAAFWKRVKQPTTTQDELFALLQRCTGWKDLNAWGKGQLSQSTAAKSAPAPTDDGVAASGDIIAAAIAFDTWWEDYEERGGVDVDLLNRLNAIHDASEQRRRRRQHQQHQQHPLRRQR